MESAESFIKEYLTKKTDYAIQMTEMAGKYGVGTTHYGKMDFVVSKTEMTGKYGVGTTHYEKTGISRMASEISTLHSKSKKYKPMYISLVDLDTIDDVTNKIVGEFFQSKYFDNYVITNGKRKTLIISNGVFELASKSFKQTKELGDFDYQLAEIKSVANDELFICFDSSERTDSSLSMNDLFTYIKSLVEVGVKVLFVK